jgi:uncharacterized protein (TIGR03086 family)
VALALRPVTVAIMTTGIDRYRTALSTFGDLVGRVDDRQWDAPSPCPGWSVRDVVEHMTGAHRTLLTMLGAAAPEPPPATREAWEDTEAAVRTAIADPTLAEREFAGPAGQLTGSELLDMSLVEPLVHGWDLATAIGADAAIDPECAARALAVGKQHEAMLRAPGMYGPAVAPPADADIGEQLLAYLGRDPRQR